MVLILGGMVDMFNYHNTKFMQLPPDCLFNDYQLLFGLKSNITYKSYAPPFLTEKQFKKETNFTRTMNLAADKFLDLLELYPDTKENLKLRALEKRSIFMYYKNKVQSKFVSRRGSDSEPSEKPNVKENKKNPLLFRSTYIGAGRDSDDDQYHITMPFQHSEHVHH